MALPARDDGQRPAAGVLPPWLWCWLITYVVNLPNLVVLSRSSIDSLLQFRPLPLEASAIGPSSLLGLASIAELVPIFAVATGILAIGVPWIRAASLERRFSLSGAEPRSGAVDEIAAFVGRFAPGLRLKVNLLRTDHFAFIYPSGYGSATLALFGGIVRLWRGDRAAAEAVLLHEIGHLRHGDVPVVGVGSLFGAAVTWWVPIVLASFVAPACVVAADQAARFVREGTALDMAAPDLIVHELGRWVGLMLPALVAGGVALLLHTASMFILPLAAIWMSEVNADRFACDTATSPDALVRAIDRLAVRPSWWRWLLLRLSHPPNRLRRAVARQGGKTSVLAIVLVLYPVAYLVRLAVLLVHATVVLTVTGAGAGRLAEALGRGTETYIDAVRPVWLAMTALVLMWPLLGVHWERICGGLRSSSSRVRLASYVAAAAILLVLAAIARLRP